MLFTKRSVEIFGNVVEFTEGRIEGQRNKKKWESILVCSFVLEPHAFPDENENGLKHDSTSGEALGESGLS